MIIKSITKLADAIHSNYLLLPILNRFGIQLGFGDKTVEQVCNDHQVNQQFFLEIVNSFLNENYFPESELKEFPLRLIIDYINHSHRFYTDIKIPQIKKMITGLLDQVDEEEKRSYKLIENFYDEYTSELKEHIENEEKTILPYILKIEEAWLNNAIDASILDSIEKHSIENYARDHENIEDKLYDLKNLIIKYLPPMKDFTLSNSILYELFRLERDLNDHARIEDKVLVPKVRQLEKQIVSRSTK